MIPMPPPRPNGREQVPVGAGPYQPRPGQIGDEPETSDEAQSLGPDREWTYWEQEIDAALRGERRFRREGEKATELVFGDESKTFDEWGQDQTHIIASTIETMRPLVYAETPEPIVRRVYRGDGHRNPVHRVSAEIVQRLAKHLIRTSPFDTVAEAVRDDWLVVGRGSARVIYRAEFEQVVQPVMDPATGAVAMQPQERKTSETVQPRHWPWRRFLVGPAPTRQEVPWIAYLSFLTRQQMTDRFGDEIAGRAVYPHGGRAQKRGLDSDSDEADFETFGRQEREQVGSKPTPASRRQCAVWEIWDHRDRTVKWWSPDYKGGLLDTDTDPLDLKDFWDTPQLLLANTRNDSLVPRSDIAYMHGRAQEIDQATKKLADILDKIAVAGAYPGSMTNVLRTLLSGKSQLIPVENWLAFAEKAGVDGSRMIAWLPIEQFVKAAQALYEMRERSKMLLFESSGISDIVRGQGDPNETATAQQIKGRYAGMRVGLKQTRFAQYLRDLIALMVDAALGLFDIETIIQIVQMDLPRTEAERLAPAMEHQQAMAQWQMVAQQAQAMGQEPPPPPPEPKIAEASWEQIEPFIRDDFTRCYAIDIETDSTLAVDEDEDRKSRIEFLTAFAGFVEALAPMAGQKGMDFRLVKELLLFGVRGFRAARTLEGMIEAIPDDIDTTPPEDVQVQVAKIRAQAMIEVAQINQQTDIAEQQLENDADLQEAQMQADARREEAAAQRALTVKMKGADMMTTAATHAARAS